MRIQNEFAASIGLVQCGARFGCSKCTSVLQVNPRLLKANAEATIWTTLAGIDMGRTLTVLILAPVTLVVCLGGLSLAMWAFDKVLAVLRLAASI